MKNKEIIIARIYLHESRGEMAELLKYLHDESKVKGVTVFRGVTGFGNSGKYHSSSLMDMSLDLPVVIEFFDDTEKMNAIIEILNSKLKPGHLVFWPALTTL